MQLSDCFKVGYIQRPHGLKGAVAVGLEPDLPVDLKASDAIFVEINNQLVPYILQSVSLQGNRAIAKFEDVDTPAQAEFISKKSIYLPKTVRPKSGRGQFYDDEVVGFLVIDEIAGTLGEIRSVSTAGSNKLLTIHSAGREVLIPLNSPFIKRVNKKEKRILVSLPEGFLDI